ncbi:MAG: ABC transporter permease subunit, partial [Reyranellaceae bacterium]
MDYQWDFTFVLNSIPWLLTGVLNTLKLSAVALFFGLLIGLIVGIGRTSKTLLVRFPATCYVEFFRYIPGLVQLVWCFFVIPVLT